ncbi:MAG TPA: hypothetical protein ENJ09_12370 [Planctomycetes bacterium]|nr:hypothetical protein [Planctomycetota bacterium]
MKHILLLAFLAFSSCAQTEPRPASSPGERSSDQRFALEQILREVGADKTPVGELNPAPRTADEAVAGLRALGVAPGNAGTPRVAEYRGFFICSWDGSGGDNLGQKGWAVNRQTGRVFEWTRW